VWLIIVGSRFGGWIYWTSLSLLQLITTVHTLNSFLMTSLTVVWISDRSLVFYYSARLTLCEWITYPFMARCVPHRGHTHLNGSSLVICISVATVMCLPKPLSSNGVFRDATGMCLAKHRQADGHIAAFRRHTTISLWSTDWGFPEQCRSYQFANGTGYTASLPQFPSLSKRVFLNHRAAARYRALVL
jgi:hypothetical protein